jgi:ribosome-associated protein
MTGAATLEERKSKSQKKREMLDLQSLGERLVQLTEQQLRRVEIPEDLRDAVLFARNLKKGEALRRQLQYIGTLMRDVEPEPLKKTLDEIGRGLTMDRQVFRKIEKWRDDLVDGHDDLLEEIMVEFPDADLKWLRQCVLNARKERAADRPPKSSRALFRYLKNIAMPQVQGTNRTS